MECRDLAQGRLKVAVEAVVVPALAVTVEGYAEGGSGGGNCEQWPSHASRRRRSSRPLGGRNPGSEAGEGAVWEGIKSYCFHRRRLSPELASCGPSFHPVVPVRAGGRFPPGSRAPGSEVRRRGTGPCGGYSCAAVDRFPRLGS